MSEPIDGLSEMFTSSDMDSWNTMMEGAQQSQPVKPSLDPAVYKACFDTPMGKLVLADMYARYVNITIVEPGQAPETHGIRQGQANVVFDIVDQITQANEGDPE